MAILPVVFNQTICIMNIIITGCSRGIGLELVKYLASSGEHKILGIARNKDSLSELEKSIGNNVFKGIVFDLTNIFELPNVLLSEIQSYFEHIDVLINNAGVLYNKPFEETNLKEIEHTFRANVFAPLELTRQLLPLLEKSTKAHVVNIGSMGGFQGSAKFSGLSWYSSSKAAFACISECLAVELSGKNIAVNCLALGAVQTEMLASAFPGYKAPVSPAEMAAFIGNFALNGQAVFNGRVIPVSVSTI